MREMEWGQDWSIQIQLLAAVAYVIGTRWRLLLFGMKYATQMIRYVKRLGGE